MQSKSALKSQAEHGQAWSPKGVTFTCKLALLESNSVQPQSLHNSFVCSYKPTQTLHNSLVCGYKLTQTLHNFFVCGYKPTQTLHNSFVCGYKPTQTLHNSFGCGYKPTQSLHNSTVCGYTLRSLACTHPQCSVFQISTNMCHQLLLCFLKA